jgi:hypothetical protein
MGRRPARFSHALRCVGVSRRVARGAVRSAEPSDGRVGRIQLSVPDAEVAVVVRFDGERTGPGGVDLELVGRCGLWWACVARAVIADVGGGVAAGAAPALAGDVGGGAGAGAAPKNGGSRHVYGRPARPMRAHVCVVCYCGDAARSATRLYTAGNLSPRLRCTLMPSSVLFMTWATIGSVAWALGSVPGRRPLRAASTRGAHQVSVGHALKERVGVQVLGHPQVQRVHVRHCV